MKRLGSLGLPSDGLQFSYADSAEDYASDTNCYHTVHVQYSHCDIHCVLQGPVTQVAFVDPPQLDFDLKLPSDSHGSGLLDYVEGWADAFISDNVLSKYVLPDHYFSQIDSVGPLATAIPVCSHSPSAVLSCLQPMLLPLCGSLPTQVLQKGFICTAFQMLQTVL